MDVVKRESYTVRAETEKDVTTMANGKTSDPVAVSAVVHAKLNNNRICTEFCPTIFCWVKKVGYHKCVEQTAEKGLYSTLEVVTVNTLKIITLFLGP
jgi:hypothetical protein